MAELLFLNRKNSYKSWGYDSSYIADYTNKKGFTWIMGWRINYFCGIEQIHRTVPQPFYTKIIYCHQSYPYPLDSDNESIPKTDTGDKTVDGYVQTAHYLDQALGEFIQYLKDVGLYNNSLIMMYGDHYGISGNHEKASAKLLGQKTFNDFDNLQFQRVPLIFHMPGLKGGVNHTYGGEIDVLPTLMNLLGVDSEGTIQFGSDLLSTENRQIVAQRNGDFVTPKYSKVSTAYYDTATGKKISKPTKKQKEELAEISNSVTSELSLSDRVITGNLLRFYEPKWFKKINKKTFIHGRRYWKALKEAWQNYDN